MSPHTPPQSKHKLRIAVAGPYSAPTADQRRRNLLRMNQAAAEVAQRGHIPIVGVNAALGIVDAAGYPDPADGPNSTEKNDLIMLISLAVVEPCDAILHLADSPGANKERDLIASKGGLVFTSIDQLPAS